MLYLSIVPSEGKRFAAMQRHGVGVMLSPDAGDRSRLMTQFGGSWAADNGCFAKGESFSLDRFYGWPEIMSPARSTCLFAVAPDVVGDADATWERSRDVLPVLRQMGYRAAYVAQDGIDQAVIEWDAFDCLFIGGTTGWKLSEAAYGIVREAKARGKWTHMGRCNSWRRLKAAAVSSYDSADGTHVAFGPDIRLPELLSWLERLRRQPILPLGITL